MSDRGNCPDCIEQIEAQAAQIEYWKTEARNVRRELKSEQKQTDSAMDNYDAMQRRCEAQAAEIEKLREALHTPLAFIEALHENDPDDQIADNGMTVLDGLKQQAPSVIKTIRAALGETK